MTKQNLSEGSKSYHDETKIYERFSQVEDTPGMILNYLQPLVKETVLDLGCGSGKYLVPLAPFAKRYVGLDVSSDQLEIAKSKSRDLNNVEFLCSSAEKIDLSDESIDTVISTWVLGTILDENRRTKVVKETERVLKQNGDIYLVENDLEGDFERIRSRHPNTEKTRAYNDWLETQGFSPIERFETYFNFESLKEAKQIFGSIWGEKAKNNVLNKKISHKIVIYHKKT